MPLKIRQEQFEALKKPPEDQFVCNIQQALVEKYPHCLPRFPDAIQKRIVRNMLDRARYRGLASQAALAAFAELMMAIAPNFDEQPDINQAISALPDEDREAEFHRLAETLPAQVWKAAESTIETLPLYLSSGQINLPLLEKTQAALPLLLWDRQDLEMQALAQSSYDQANALGIIENNDAPITCAVWQTLYGKDYNNQTVHAWLKDIFDHQRSPKMIIAMLKFRIMLDHKRWV